MPGPPPRPWDTWKHLVAGSTAGLASTAATYPLDTLKVAFLSLTLSLAPRVHTLAAPGDARHPHPPHPHPLEEAALL